MRKSLLKISATFSSLFLLLANLSIGQTDLPVGFSAEEQMQMKTFGLPEPISGSAITTPPSGPVRAMAQWEEEGSLVVTWRSYESVLREIVRAARKETTVIINCNPSTGSASYKDSTDRKSVV